MKNTMKITNLNVQKGSKQIIKGLNLNLEPGINILMGLNGCGKTTLSYTIAGHPDCNVLSGEAHYQEQNILEQDIQERSLNGIYLAPQYPSVIEGLSHAALMKEAINIRQLKKNQAELDEFDFLTLLKNKATQFNFNPKDYVRNSLNYGYSGGEKKRNEMLQISLLNPSFIILDEIDSGLDIEAMKNIANFINEYALNNNAIFLIITHYPNFAKLLNVSKVYVMKDGNISKTGNIDLVSTVETEGFGE